MRVRSLLVLPLAAALLGAAGGSALSAPGEQRAEEGLHVRAFPLRRDGERGTLWLEVTGPKAQEIESGVQDARLMLGQREYRPERAHVKIYEGPERTILLDGERVDRQPGAAYIRFAFSSLPADTAGARFSWVPQRKEPGEPLRWEISRAPRRKSDLEPRTGQGFQVAVPAFRWQEDGNVEVPGTTLRGTADRSLWVHMRVRPDPAAGGRFPDNYAGYEVRFRTDGRTLQPVTVNGNGTRGNNEDRHDILAIFRVEPDASGTLEWVPVYSRSTGQALVVDVPNS